jgi:FkbM family methyltransferase
LIAVVFGHGQLRQLSPPLEKFPAAGSKFTIPPGKKVVEINVGTSVSPMSASGPEVFLILVEPIPEIASHVKKMVLNTATVINSAISNFSGTALFHRYKNNWGGSSSLSPPRAPAYWNKDETTINVTVHTLKELLEAVPEEVPIQFLKTDMQGHDLTAIKSAGDLIKRVSRIKSEVYADGEPSYRGVDNSNTSFLSYMNDVGFRPLSPCTPWRRLQTEIIGKPRRTKRKKGKPDKWVVHEGNCEFVPKSLV